LHLKEKFLMSHKKKKNNYNKEYIAGVCVIEIWEDYLPGTRFSVNIDGCLEHLKLQNNKLKQPYQQRWE